MSDQISNARERLEEKWDSYGECRSCGWHASLHEHGDIPDERIEDALQNGGVLRLTCISKDADEPEYHRGVYVFLGEERTK